MSDIWAGRVVVAGCAAPSVDFTHCGDMFADFYSAAYLTSQGVVNVHRNGFGGNSRFQPLCGETFSAFAIANTNDPTATALYTRRGDTDGRDVYLFRETGLIHQIGLPFGSNGAVVNDPGWNYVTSLSVRDGFTGYGYALAFPEQVWRWDRGDEPDANATLFVTDLPGGGSFWNRITETDDGRIWVGGGLNGSPFDTSAVRCYNPDGTLAGTWSDPRGYGVEGLTAWNNGVVVFHLTPAADEHLWTYICPNVMATDMVVTLDGGDYHAVYDGTSVGNSGGIHSKGDQLVFATSNNSSPASDVLVGTLS